MSQESASGVWVSAKISTSLYDMSMSQHHHLKITCEELGILEIKNERREWKGKNTFCDHNRLEIKSQTISFKYLAILFFLEEYNSSLRNLPGVVDDKKELKQVLSKYTKRIYTSSENVLDDLRKVIKEFKQKDFERVHFHFSGKLHP